MSLAHHHQAHIVSRSANQKPGELLISQSEARRASHQPIRCEESHNCQAHSYDETGPDAYSIKAFLTPISMFLQDLPHNSDIATFKCQTNDNNNLGSDQVITMALSVAAGNTGPGLSCRKKLHTGLANFHTQCIEN